MGTIFAGGIATGIYTTNSPSACKYCAETSDCTVILCDGKAELEKYLLIQSQFKPLCYIVYNMAQTEKPQSEVKIFTFEEFLDNNEGITDTMVYTIIENQNPGQCCAMIYTSGTTV